MIKQKDGSIRLTVAMSHQLDVKQGQIYAIDMDGPQVTLHLIGGIEHLGNHYNKNRKETVLRKTFEKVTDFTTND